MKRFMLANDALSSAKRTWDNKLLTDVFTPRHWEDEETMCLQRIAVPEEDRAKVSRKLHKRGADDLIALLDEHGWDMYFLVDAS